MAIVTISFMLFLKESMISSQILGWNQTRGTFTKTSSQDQGAVEKRLYPGLELRQQSRDTIHARGHPTRVLGRPVPAASETIRMAAALDCSPAGGALWWRQEADVLFFPKSPADALWLASGFTVLPLFRRLGCGLGVRPSKPSTSTLVGTGRPTCARPMLLGVLQPASPMWREC
ncbi:hypothetical protein K432DRAFT_82024 [Lepidopterella palustris CBS 459.81]|uniref:Uncharacterized protein n=1 Tax=Lepidopterella palustris CBS 459.81 TaxID=1314670 RepID=A0A8E2JJP7_9PEZI|nr:hypothetical protein K432DRAFT_82024 [Lepidopterella palustris CBS 459.81]